MLNGSGIVVSLAFLLSFSFIPQKEIIAYVDMIYNNNIGLRMVFRRPGSFVCPTAPVRRLLLSGGQTRLERLYRLGGLVEFCCLLCLRCEVAQIGLYGAEDHLHRRPDPRQL